MLIIQKKDPKGPTPPLSMPSFRGSEEELNDLVAYVVSLDTPPSVVSTTRPPVPASMLGKGNCRVCHAAVVKQFESNIHAKAWPEEDSRSDIATTCAVCHGDGDRHAQNPSDLRTIIRFNDVSSASAHDKNAACLACHERGLRFSWRGSAHESRDMVCADCHKIMAPASDRRLLAKQQEMEVCFQCHQVRRAQLQRTSHMPLREAKVTCTDCHNPHGTTAEKLLSADSVNETCYKCHAEKRGPFLWEHPPVAESCLNCHEPHGSNHASLLKSERPRLCQRCHIEARHPTTPQPVASRFVFNRSCQNCHSQIHGSNHPSGVRFQR
ncbi:MAG: DmsE family decaheme c-type cytochrome [Candidatus Latescibacteria bacterium]|nr:DmsE family decaheme c-type cytochrome [Candidatus Latescibacterota bacterium]